MSEFKGSKNYHTPYQKGIIKNWFANKDTLRVQQLSDCVTELYLATDEKKKTKLWAKVEKALKDLEVHSKDIAYIMENRNLNELAKILKAKF